MLTQLPNDVQSIVHKHLFEESYRIVREELLNETAAIKEFVDQIRDSRVTMSTLVTSMGTYRPGRSYRITKCTYCSSGWLVRWNIPLHFLPSCAMCTLDVENSDIYHPPMRVHHTNEYRKTNITL